MLLERRYALRVAMRVEVTVTSRHNFFSAHTRDISEGGLFIETNARLEVGDRMDLDVRCLKHAETIEAEVAWTLTGDHDEPVGVGVRFVDPGERVKRAVAAFMALRAPIPFTVE